MEDDVVKAGEASVEAGSAEKVETQEVDYEALYKQSEQEKVQIAQERNNLASLMGRQSQELGELRKASQPVEKEIKSEDYFDETTSKVINKIVDQRVESRIKADRESRDKESLQKDFKSVYDQYDVTEENLTDLAYLASAKKISLPQAAEELAKKGIIEKRNKGVVSAAETTVKDGMPTGMPKVPSEAGTAIDPRKMSTEQWSALSDEKRQELLAKYTAK